MPVQVLIIGAGSRGLAYSKAIAESTDAVVAAVAEPVAYKRDYLGSKCIWKDAHPRTGQTFSNWTDFVEYEQLRRQKVQAGEHVEPGVDAVVICILEEQHEEAILALAPLRLHVLSEKPLAPTLDACLNIYSSLQPDDPSSGLGTIFGICHVMRYSPHNVELHDLVVNKKIIGDVLSLEHTEPVGWWHFSHSYVRGNWRREDTSAPSLLTKSCHDIDFVMWMLSHDAENGLHLPHSILSSGRLNQYRKARKPSAAGAATNCLSCAHEQDCLYSAKKIYLERHLRKGWTDWPVSIVVPDIEETHQMQGPAEAEKHLLRSLSEDYNPSTSDSTIKSRNWFGRCVWEADNNVCDDQTVTMVWNDDTKRPGLLAKTATFHMIAQTEAQCERRGRVYGTLGEVSYDSKTIRVYDFASSQAREFTPKEIPGNHGGGDTGLIIQFISAVNAVKSEQMTVADAQRHYIGCTLEHVLRSHAAVFAAEEARRSGKPVEWDAWWSTNISKKLENKKMAKSGTNKGVNSNSL